FYAEFRYALGTDLIEELEVLCTDLMREFRRPVVFAGQLVFQRETVFTRTLHHETAFAIQRRLQFQGAQVVVLPIRAWERTRVAGPWFRRGAQRPTRPSRGRRTISTIASPSPAPPARSRPDSRRSTFPKSRARTA